MKKKAQAIFNHFGRDKQILKAKEEYLELQVALMELSKFRIKKKLLENKNSDINLVDNCNEELADNILLMLQLDKDSTFESAYNWHMEAYSPFKLFDIFMLENFDFNKDQVYKTVNEKIDRTIKRFNIEVI